MKAFPFLIFLLLAGVGCRTYGPKFDPYSGTNNLNLEGKFVALGTTNQLESSLLKSPTDPYRLGPGDVISIESVGDGVARATLLLGPDGKIYFSLLPGISLWGLSLAESRALLQQEMSKFTRATPEIVIHLVSVGSQRVWMLGAVGRPGVYGLATATTLLDAIAAAGGVPTGNSDEESLSQSGEGQLPEPRGSTTRRSFLADSRGLNRTQAGARFGNADGGVDFSRSFVMRKGKFLPVDFARLIKQGDLSQNIYLAPDDFIFFRPLELPKVYILGAVASPNILPYSGDLSVATAILSVGGTIKYAQETKVVIIRGALTQPQIAEADYQSIVTGKARDLLLQPGDIVYVPFSPFRRIAQLAEEVLDQFVRTIAANEGTYIGTGQQQPVGVTASDFRIITQ